MAAKKTAKKSPHKPKKKVAKKPAPKKAISKKALKDPSTNAAETAPADGAKAQTKTSFVLSFPPSVPAKEVVAAGAEAGITLTEKGVYKTRYLARAKGSKTPKAALAKPAKAARRPGKRGPGDGSASSFIREQPATMKASEVVAAAKAKGISLTAGLVYSVRQAAKKKAAKARSEPTSGKRRGRPPAAAKVASKAVVVSAGGDRERQLVQLAVDLGLGRAIELIESVRARIGSLI